ncbi:MAG: sigma-70 family RNA polymerase sigma factor [Puniceicoccales bacterium]|jgi:RNA polymerase sigma-70 factor (ECF subfamily)|nr:sigma-70 family RNA polymerase sigma factor [Puniceicoccales bacterium]
MSIENPDDARAWREWFAQNGARFLLCARQWTRSHADAEDVLQDAFARFWRKQRHLPGDPAALLITSIRRAALDHVRRETRRINREQAALVLDGEPVSWFEAPDSAEDKLLADALEKLPDAQRQVVALKIWGELTFDEIARQLDCSLNTVASRYRYALAKLRETLTANSNNFDNHDRKGRL